MQVVQVKCPNCLQPITSKMKDVVFYCDLCKTIHIRDGKETKVLDFEIAESNKTITADKKYVPFWRAFCDFAILESRSSGFFGKMAQFMRGDGNSGSLFIFVPASEIDVGTFKQLAMDLTMSPPRYESRLDFENTQRLPVKITKDEAEQVSDFVFVTIQAEKPGILQDLNYSLNCKSSKLVYLPFVISGSGMRPAW